MRRRLPGSEARAERLKALRQRQAELRAELRQRMAQRPKERWRPSRWWLLVLLAILILLFLRPCQCTPPPQPGPAEPAAAPVTPAEPVSTPAPAPKATPPPRVRRMDRPELEISPPGSPPWLDAFRLQVAARSPRLAKCFEGAQQPGQLKWTTSVDPSEGTVSQHDLSPMLMTGTVTATERECLLAVLTDPPYRLPQGKGPSTPARVGLVIEF